DEVDVGGSNVLLVNVTSERSGELVIDELICKFYINTILESITQLNQSGLCSYDVPTTYSGNINWSVNIEGNEYYNANSLYSNKTLINFLQSQTQLETQYPQTYNVPLITEIQNEQDEKLNITNEISCNYLIFYESQQIINQTSNATEGICQVIFNTNHTTINGDYQINITIFEEPESEYLIITQQKESYNFQIVNPIEIHQSSDFIDGGYKTNLSTILKDEFSNYNLDNVSFEITLQSNHTNNVQLEVDWGNNGTYYEITLPPSNIDCNTSTPTSTTTGVGRDTLLACTKDTDSNTVIDYIKIIQPKITNSSGTHQNTTYSLFTPINNEPFVLEQNYTPQNVMWGEIRNFTLKIQDLDSLDTVAAKLWVYNYIDLEWKNLTGMVSSLTKEITLTNLFTSEYSSSDRYKFEFCDYNGTTCKIIKNSTEYSMNPIQKNEITITEIDTVGSNQLKVQLNNSRTGNIINNSIVCDYYINQESIGSIIVGNQGYCTMDIPLEYTGGTINWTVITQSNFYYKSEEHNATAQTIKNLKPDLNMENYYQSTEPVNLYAEILNGANVVENISSEITCEFSIYGGITTVMAQNVTPQEGICNYPYNLTVDDNSQTYNIKIRLYETPETEYIELTETEDSKFITVYEYLLFDVVSFSENKKFQTNITLELHPFYTEENMTDIIFSVNLNDSHIDPLTMEVDWYSNNNYYGLSIPISDNDCDADNATYSNTTIGNHTFQLCSKDYNDGNGISYIKWVTPIITDETGDFERIKYKLFSDFDNEPILINQNDTPSIVSWGENKTFNIEIYDLDSSDVIAAKLWIYNIILGSWQNITEQIISPEQNLSITRQMTKELVGANQYFIEYCDYYSGACSHEYNTSIHYFLPVQKNSINLTEIVIPESNKLVVQLNNSRTGEIINDSVLCKFYIDGSKVLTMVANDTGHCMYDGAMPAKSVINWSVETLEDQYYYSDTFETTKEVISFISPKLVLNSTQDRNTSINLTTRISNEFDALANITGNISCRYILTRNSQILLNATVQPVEGICSYLFSNNCSYKVGEYEVSLELSNTSELSGFVFVNTTDEKTYTLSDNLNMTILSPADAIVPTITDAIHFMNSQATDSCGIVTSQDSGIYWQDDREIVYTSQSFSYVIPSDTMGGITVGLYTDNEYYDLIEQDSVYFDVQDVIKIFILQKPHVQTGYNYVINRGTGETQTLQAQIYTGTNRPVDESSYIGNYSGHKCEWLQQSATSQEYTVKATTYTDETGTCAYDYVDDCNYNPGYVYFKVNLTLDNESGFNYPHESGENYSMYSRAFILMDHNVTVNLTTDLWENKDETHALFYNDGLSFEKAVKDTCGVSQINTYVGIELVTDTLSESLSYFNPKIPADFIGPTSLILNGGTWDNRISNFYGLVNYTGNIAKSTYTGEGYIYYANSTIYRNQRLISIDSPDTVESNSTHIVYCDIELTDRTGEYFDTSTPKHDVNISFYIDGVLIGINTTDSTGTAYYNFSVEESGYHELRCNVSPDYSRYFNVTTNDNYTSISKQVLVPGAVSVLDTLFVSNRELNTNVGSDDFSSFYVEQYSVFREQNPAIKEPKFMYLAASPQVYSDIYGWQYLDDITINFTIYNATPFNGTELDQLVDWVSCDVDLFNDFYQRPTYAPDEWLPVESLIDGFWNRTCITKWDPSSELDVGHYFIKPVMVKDGWDDNYANDTMIKLKGIMYVNLTYPGSDNRSENIIWTDRDNILSAVVYDDNGKYFNASDLEVPLTYYYGYYDNGYMIPRKMGVGNETHHFIWQVYNFSTYYHLDDEYGDYEVWAYLTNSSWYSNADTITQYYFDDVYKTYPDAEDRSIIDSNKIILYHLQKPKFDITQNTTCIDGAELFNVSIRLPILPYGSLMRNPTIVVECLNCNHSDNQYFNNSRLREDPDNHEVYQLSINITKENHIFGGRTYQFRATIQNYSRNQAIYLYTNETSNVTYLNVEVLKFCGSGEGLCTNDGICDADETCAICPNDCGYDLLPIEYWFDYNGTAWNGTTELCGSKEDGYCNQKYESTSSAPDCTISPKAPIIDVFTTRFPQGTSNDDLVFNNNSFDIYYSIRDPNFNLANLKIYRNDTSIYNKTYGDTISLDSQTLIRSALPDGKYSFKLNATDKTNLSSVKIINVTVDSIPPNISQIIFDKGSYANSSSIYLSINVSEENDTTIESVSLSNQVTTTYASWNNATSLWEGTTIANDEENLTITIIDTASNQIINYTSYISISSSPNISYFEINTGFSLNSSMTTTTKPYGAILNNGTNPRINISFNISDTTGLENSSIIIDGNSYCTNIYPADTLNYSGNCLIDIPRNTTNTLITLKVYNSLFYLEEDQNLYIDNTPPTLEYYPNQPQYINLERNLTINATTNDSISGMLNITFNGTNMTLLNGTEYQYNYTPLTEGIFNLTINSTDNLLNSNTSKLIVIVDNTSPNTTFIKPLFEQAVFESIYVNLTIIEPYLDTTNSILKFGNKTDCSDSNSTFEKIITSNNFTTQYNISYLTNVSGFYYLCAETYDLSQNMNLSTLKVQIDTLPPVINITTPTEGQVLVDLINYSFNVTVYDDSLNYSSIRICIDNTGSCLPNLTMTQTLGANYTKILNITTEGNWTINITASDLTGKTSFESLIFSRDNNPPTISIIPSNNTKLKGDININAEIIDEAGNGNISTYLNQYNEGVINNFTTQIGTTFYKTIDTTSGPDGEEINLTVYANDTKGHSTQKTITYYVDNNAPIITNLTVIPILTKNGTNITINTTIIDPPFPTYKNCDVYLSNDTTFDEGDALLSLNGVNCTGWTLVNDLSTATKYIIVNASDLLDNTQTNYTQIIIDNTPPTIYEIYTNITQNLLGSITESLNVTVNTSDPNGVVEVYIINDTNQLTEGPTNIWSGVFTPIILGIITEGFHNLSAYSVDTVGNIQNETFEISIDLTPPVMTNSKTYASYNITRSDAIINISVEVTENISEIDSVWVICDVTTTPIVQNTNDVYYIDTETLTTLGCPISDGPIDMEFYSNNTVGHETSINLTITIDDTAPVVTGVVFGDGVVNSGKVQLFNISNVEDN
ncbi:hypothetical protein C0585_00125, partial [Candidatus Woesearchaeota archaeon]